MVIRLQNNPGLRGLALLLLCGWFAMAAAQDTRQPSNDNPGSDHRLLEEGMLSFEAFVLPEPDYTIEVLIFQNVNTHYNRSEDWSEPELRVIAPDPDLFAPDLYDPELTTDDSGNAIVGPFHDQRDDLADDPLDHDAFADDLTDDDSMIDDGLLVDQMPTEEEPIDCAALIEEALLMEGRVPAECASEIVRFIPSEPVLLSDVVETLDTSSDYRPLALLAWSQPGYPRDESPVFELRPLGTVSTAVSGTVSLSRGRYLHLDLNLTFVPGLVDTPDHDDQSSTMTLIANQMTGQLADQTEIETPQLPEAFLLHESRRMKRDEIHYFDHPMFAAVAIVTRYEPPDDIEPDDTDSDDLDENGAGLAPEPTG